MRRFFLGLIVPAFFGLAACSGGPETGFITTVSEADVEILERTKELLSDESKWARHEETRCDLEAETWTLFCALQKASIDTIGTFELRRPALTETRYVIDQAAGDQNLDRRLIDYNNLQSTSFGDIQNVLDEALRRIRIRLAQRAGT